MAVNADIGVLIKWNIRAGGNEVELVVAAAVVGRVVACHATGQVDNAAQDGAQEVVVLRIARVVVPVVRLVAAVKGTIPGFDLDISCLDGGDGANKSGEDGDELHI